MSARRTPAASQAESVTTAAEREFLARFPAYRETVVLDQLRAADYARLDRCGCTYLDYTGGGLFGESQVRRHMDLLLGCRVLGNPHSHNPASLASTGGLDDARAAVREFFNAPEDEFEVVFTANATGALKLVGEAYPFHRGGRYLLSYDNHNSVNGIREFAYGKGAQVDYVPVRRSDLRLDEDALARALRHPHGAPDRLFAYPAQSNFSGVQHPLEWVKEAQQLGWDVLLDCAAYAPTNPLDLHAVRPDYAVVSFYKLFGYPTGIGALIARRPALAKLRRPWFAGGTIAFASVQADEGYRLAPGAPGFEDGTVDYLGLPAVTIGLQHLADFGMPTIHLRVTTLAAWLLEELPRLRHGDGAPLVRVFGPAGMERRGAVIALQFLDPAGRPYDVYEVEREAGAAGICVRTGCFCNPGDGEVAHDISREDMERCFHDTRGLTTLMECQRLIEDTTGKVPNTLRVSLGLVSTFADVSRFLAFSRRYLDRAR